MKIKLDKWDNSLALRIPKSLANKAKLKEGSVIDLSIENGNLVIQQTDLTQCSLKSLLDQVKDDNIHKETATGHRVGKELL